MKTIRNLSLILVLSITAIAYGQEKTASELLYEAIYCEEITGELDKAENLLNQVLADCGDKRVECAQALYHLGLIAEKTENGKAEKLYVRLIENYPDVGEYASLARSRIEKIRNAKENPELISISEYIKKKDIPPKDGP